MSITMGRHTYNATNDIECYEKNKLIIGNFCSIGSGLKIYTGLHPNIENPDVVSQYPFHEQWKVDYPPSVMTDKVIIGNDVWISTDVGILGGVTIGDGVIVAARSMVTKDVPPYAFVAGNPARIKKYRFWPGVIGELLIIKWWDWSDEKIRKEMESFNDIKTFIKKHGKIKN